MKVLHLPVNVASQIRVTVLALRNIGIETHGLVAGGGPAHYNSSALDTLDVVSSECSFVGRRLAELCNAIRVFRAIRNADVVHWHYGATGVRFGMDLCWATMLGKPGLVEFWGSDIRVPEEEAAVNPYYRAAIRNPEYEYRHETRTGSYARQESFVRRGVKQCLVVPEMGIYLKPGLWSGVHKSRSRVLLDEFAALPPDPAVRKPVIAHSPTAPIAKGTAAVLEAVDKLRTRFDFEFRLIQNVPYEEAQRIKQTCDIFLDQFIGGSYGLSAVEAFAMAKPVLCYMRPTALAVLPPDCPVVNANPDNLAEALEPLLANGALRRQIGLRSRAYAETHHDAHRVAAELGRTYQQLLTSSTRSRTVRMNVSRSGVAG